MHNGSGVSFILGRISRAPRPERADEQAQIALASQGDKRSIELLISANLAYVVHIAKEFRGRGLPFEDLIAEGTVGLLKAIRRYRAVNGTRFITYASFWVRKEILAAVSDQPHPIHVPRYARQHGHESIRVLRLDAPIDAAGGIRIADRLRHPDPSAADTVVLGEQRVSVRREVLRLSRRERSVIAWRFGLDGQPPMTLEAIAGRLGVSKERVRQIEVSALERLRGAIGVGFQVTTTLRPRNAGASKLPYG